MIVKVCGMREADNIRAVEALGIDWMGFIFWPPSKRYVSQPPDYLPEKVRRVGVFVDAEIGTIRQHIVDYHLDIVQLHGHESPDDIRLLKDKVRIVKAISIVTAGDLSVTADYDDLVDYYLFDTKAALPGGNGTQFDWNILQAYTGRVPFLLSGGIGPDDAQRLKSFHHPLLAGIDLNSRFETTPGFKDINKLKKFLYE